MSLIKLWDQLVFYKQLIDSLYKKQIPVREVLTELQATAKDEHREVRSLWTGYARDSAGAHLKDKQLGDEDGTQQS